VPTVTPNEELIHIPPFTYAGNPSFIFSNTAGVLLGGDTLPAGDDPTGDDWKKQYRWINSGGEPANPVGMFEGE